MVIFVVDQYEEAVADSASVPSRFVEQLSLLDRGELRRYPMLFIWLTTRTDFQSALVSATSRNRRILLQPDFELHGPPRNEWPNIVKETFSFHNSEKPLADFQILQSDLEEISASSDTLGTALLLVGERLGAAIAGLQDISQYQIVMLWPVTDGTRISRIQQFTDARQGYKLDWDAWYRQLNDDDRRQLPLTAYNRTRLYFDMRVVPIAAADLHHLCRSIEQDEVDIADTYLNRFKLTHFYSIVSGSWNAENYSPLRERDSERAKAANAWYHTITDSPGKLGKRIALCLRKAGVPAFHEREIVSRYGRVVTDILATRDGEHQNSICIELKAFSADNTMPSTIKEQIRITLRKYANLVGFLPKQ